MEELFERVREEADRGVWARGVELARSEAVLGERADGGEVTVRVRGQGVVHPRVILYVEDAEWECSCAGRDDPCEHVAAAVIAVRRAKREGDALPTAGAAARVGYRFARVAEGLALERVAVAPDGTETPLTTTLAALASGRVAGPEVVATQADLQAEHALGPRLAGVLPRGVLIALLRPLEQCPDVRLDGEPLRCVAEPTALRAHLVDDGDGFRLFVSQDPPVAERVGNDLARCGDTLREIGPSRLSGRELAELTGRGRHIPADEIAKLVAETLPDLERRLAVSIDTNRLPGTRREPPRLRIEASREGDRLSLLPTLVYGDPPIARVDAGRLTHLRGPVPLRDEAGEARLAARLRAELGLVPGRRAELEADEAVGWLEQARRSGIEIAGEQLEGFRRAAPLEARVQIDGETLEVAFRSPGDSGGDADPGAVLAAWRRGDALVPLLDGGFAAPPAEWLARHGQRLADLLAARDADHRIARALLPELGQLCDDLGEPRPDAVARMIERLERADPDPARAIPDDVRADLRGYQTTGAAWLVRLGDLGLGALLADDMGLGKTLQALCALRRPALIVAPTSLLGNWASEIERFRPGLRLNLYHGPRRALDAAADVTLTSHALLRLDREVFEAERFETAVIDEAQAIKNPASQVAQAAFALGAERRIALTGTPVENRLEELWSQLHFLNPGLLGSRADFALRYADPIGAGDEGAAEHLRNRIAPFVLRRRKREVAPELPERTESVLRVDLSDEERAVYDAIRAATLEQVVAQLEGGSGVMQALEVLLRLRQACCATRLVPGQDETTSSKLELLRDRLCTAQEDGHKALVFSQWTQLLDLIEPVLDEAGVPFVRLDGSTRDRSGVVDQFQRDDGPPVFLVSLRAGGTGLNLTAADHVFLLDPWWNPAVEDQAADRAHRIGQDKPVFVYRMVARDTVEERILALQARKREIAEAAVGGATAAPKVSRDELLALLRD